MNGSMAGMFYDCDVGEAAAAGIDPTGRIEAVSEGYVVLRSYYSNQKRWADCCSIHELKEFVGCTPLLQRWRDFDIDTVPDHPPPPLTDPEGVY